MWLLLACATVRGGEAAPTAVVERAPMSASLSELMREVQASPHTWARLSALCDRFPRRFAGTQTLTDAGVWASEVWARDGVTTRLDPVSVRHWVRGREQVTMVAPVKQSLAVLGLGGTVSGTVTAQVVVVTSFEQLGPHVAGKIVLYNVPMAEGLPSIDHYGPAVAFRGRGAAEAAKHGAVASLVRSVTTRSLYTPHTGGQTYGDGPKIPAAAITVEDAEWISRLVGSGTEVTLTVSLASEELPRVESWNVIGEVTGQTPEIVLIGAHLDSWDVGQGAHDDGAGVAHVMEAMRAIAAQVKATGKPPLRTIRGVLYANEEFGLDGAKAYAAAYGNLPHKAAMESDLGGGAPLSWGATGTPEQLAWLRSALAPLGMPVTEGGGGADISTLEPFGVLMVGLQPDDSHYFDVHHTEADTLDKVDPAALSAGAAAVAGWAWQVANTP